MPAKLGPVLVCKEYSEAYAVELSNRGFKPHFLQVLDTSFVNGDLLRQTISEDLDQRFDGVVVTSSRAAEAWVNTLNSLLEVQDGNTSFTEKWNDTIFYVVGKATAKAMKASSFIPSNRILGAESGTGEAIARFIVAKYSTLHDGDRAKLSFLLLTGDKNRETIPTILTEAHLNFHKLQVYETDVVPTLETSLKDVINTMKSEDEVDMPWVVFFSPSTVDSIASVMSAIQQPTEFDDSNLSSFRIATIGPTTAAHIRSLGYEVCISSPKPDPGTLAESLLAYVTSA